MMNRTVYLLYTRNIKQVKRLWFSTILPENSASFHIKKKQDENKYNTMKIEELEHKKYFLKDDPNLFGSLTKPTKDLINDDHVEEGDIKEETHLENPVSRSKQLRTKQYADIIKEHIRKRQIKEALDVLEIRMIKEDKVKPDAYIYNLILGVCGRVGYTKKAFKLFNDMKKRGLNPTNGTYTALFNACANSPWIEDGLARATKLREIVTEKRVILNDTNYNSMIKAFGRCGDLQTAFLLVDEMIENQVAIKDDTINFLLQSCISDKEVGFRHALLVWRKFHKKRITPNIYSFNLILRCVRDCSLGDAESFNKLLESPEFKQLNSNLQIESTNKDLQLSQNTLTENIDKTDLDIICNPNLMARVPYLGNIIKLNEISKPEDRLLLIGGCSGFLKNMEEFNIKPDIKTFSQLLDCIPSTLSAEKALLSAMKKEGVKYDVDFLNMLIKKRSMRMDYDNARDVVGTMFRSPKLRPNIMTYGVLALGCQSKDEADLLIKEMQDCGYRMNIEILGAMLKSACIQMNFVYVLELMELLIKQQIKPNKIFIQHLEDLYRRAKHESGEKKGNFFMKGFKLFRMRYKTWLEEISVDKSDDEHPWQQFRDSTETNVKNYKDKSVHFKPRVSSRFRQKTGTLHK